MAEGFEDVARIEAETDALLRAWQLREAHGESGRGEVIAANEGNEEHVAIVIDPTPDAANTANSTSNYSCLLSSVVLTTHVASLVCQLVSVASPYFMPDVFARLSGEMVCERVQPTQRRVARAVQCKVLRIGSAVFTPGMLLSPYFAALALSDLVCWSVEFRRPGSLPFQGDSLANLVAWIDRQGGFAKLLDVLGSATSGERVEKAEGAEGAEGADEADGAEGAEGASPSRSLPGRLITRMRNELRKTLVSHGDPAWQKAFAVRVRQASAALFVGLIARLPFSDDTTSLPDGLLDFYLWLEKAGGATKLAAAGSESLVKPSAPKASDEASDDAAVTDDDLQSIRIDARETAPE
ncbi:hypothetical protein [Pandoraea capi]|uniref:hypothetical protein n=1 Tax=Pandoraea capi TaxID=2508286 RepID=UPI001242D8C7|nr:hypothetical protein [Pandoraea capi]